MRIAREKSDRNFSSSYDILISIFNCTEPAVYSVESLEKYNTMRSNPDDQ